MRKRQTPTISPIQFPNPRILPDSSDGLVYIGGNLDIETLKNAYRLGIFPWPLESQYPLFWFCPEPRGILKFDNLHVPRSLEKLRRKNLYHFTFNRAFARVIQSCADQPRRGQEGTWIIPELIPAYIKFHEAGYAHSIECWNGSKLVGGLYGIFIDGVFSGESMFHHEPNVSKLCLLEIAKALEKLGLKWMDIQMITPATESLGGQYVSRQIFLDLLEKTHRESFNEKLVFPTD